MGDAPVAQFQEGLSGSQTNSGACRSEGLVAGEHVPDRLRELSREVDLRDLGAALATEAALGALVALAVERVGGGVDGGLHQPPAQIARAVLGDRATPVHVAGLASGAVWATGGGAVARIDPRTVRLVATVEAGASRIAAGREGVWFVSARNAGAVTQIDPRTNRAREPIRVGEGGLSGIAVAAGRCG